MFTLSHPWWEYCVRAALIYGAVLVMMRLSGKRTVGQFTPFDLLVMLLLSEAVSNSLAAGDDSISAGWIVAASLIALNATLGFLTSRSRRLEAFIEGSPVLIGRDGKIYKDVLLKHRIGQGDMAKALREADCELEDMKCVFLEPDGNISVLKRKNV